ncbi:MAG: cytochrome c3 family protein [Anaerolineales bacterium]|nr:cytochrome c3 family protein [Anaerolineales bacterium]
MAKFETRMLAAILAVSGAIAFGSAIVSPSPALAQEGVDYCLSCHNDPALQMTLPDGESLSLYASEEMLARSAHGSQGLTCQACHSEITTYPHPEIKFNTRRELSRSYYQACQKCHSTNYDKALDSIHAEMAAAGKLEAPICTDCHGAHEIKALGEPRTHISETCGQCHASVYAEYKASVHGGALSQGNPDVPVCTDCHGVHSIADPRTPQFRVKTPELCAGCHADAELMAKYGLSAEVYDIYQLSWHGVDVSVYKARWPTIWHDSAVCTDCHGIHNIRTTLDPESTVNPARLLATCQKCHPGAGPNWTGAWTGHNSINLVRTPYLFYTKVFYEYFVKLVLWLSIIYVALQIIRSTVDRVRRSLQ